MRGAQLREPLMLQLWERALPAKLLRHKSSRAEPAPTGADTRIGTATPFRVP